MEIRLSYHNESQLGYGQKTQFIVDECLNRAFLKKMHTFGDMWIDIMTGG
jgi:hypothetical protein